MSREILFRGKRIDSGEWVEGETYLYDPDLKRISIGGYDYYSTGEGLQREEYCFEVDPETVGQYTGLTDKNGKKIFDGDVILFEKKKYFVVWLDSIASFVAKPFEEGRCWPCMNVGTMKEAEIIGNIFDNPEVMENLERSKK